MVLPWELSQIHDRRKWEQEFRLNLDSGLLFFSASVSWISSRFSKISIMIADAYASGVSVIAG